MKKLEIPFNLIEEPKIELVSHFWKYDGKSRQDSFIKSQSANEIGNHSRGAFSLPTSGKVTSDKVLTTKASNAKPITVTRPVRAFTKRTDSIGDVSSCNLDSDDSCY